ncbi:MAG: glycosyltransferase family 4 protein [Cyclobacteriaceae bacterium]|jgi:glycosyltransferase involved in cell wall biosynthesis
MKILFLAPYPPNSAPSQRFRFEQYFKLLLKEGHTITVKPFLSSNDYKVIYSPGRRFQKILIIALGLVKRAGQIRAALRHDWVFIHREAAPVGPPIIEWIIARLLKKKVIYDFDDAIWLTDKKNEDWIDSLLRYRKKVKSICRWSFRVSCGNQYLTDYAAQFAKQVIINPTTIDTEYVQNQAFAAPAKLTEQITIGWTGTHSTLKYLDSITDVLGQLEKMYPNLRFLVIADRNPGYPLRSYVFKAWDASTEISDLKEIDIGIMPLPDDQWTRGKCGFKILQYLSLGIPAVASPVGVNKRIITPANGLLANTPDEWMNSLELLIQKADLRRQMGREGVRMVEENYSVDSNSGNFLALFN